MRPSIRLKLVASMLAASVVGIVAITVATQYGFRHSFLDYLNEQGLERLEALVAKAAEFYRKTGSWDYLRTHPDAWLALVGIPGRDRPSIEIPALPDARVFAVAFATIDVSGTALRISLLDADRQFLIGYPKHPPDSPERAVIVDGHTVGWLYLAPLREVSNYAERRFQRQQLILIWTLGTLAVLAASLIAILLSRAFLAPIQAIAATARRLAAGDFTARVEPASQDEIGQLARDVSQLAQALEKNEGARRNLMADISHEFRTPLAVLRAELEAIEDGVRPATRASIHSLLTEVGTLNELVQDIHELAMADLGALSYRRSNVNAGEILRTCLAAFQRRFEQQSLRMTATIAEEDLLVYADEGRLQQLFNNLLDNSVRHTDPGGRIHIDARPTAEGVRILIEDSEPGVPADALSRLFERFFRVDSSRSRATGGSGLGMAICRGIVDAHGGRIEAASSELGGLRITVDLPGAVAPALAYA